MDKSKDSDISFELNVEYYYNMIRSFLPYTKELFMKLLRYGLPGQVILCKDYS